MSTRANLQSDQISGAGKENETESAELEQPKKRTRAQPPQGESTKESRVLSPASSNIRTLPRTTPGGKAAMTRPGLNTVAGASSPVKQHSSSNLFSNLAEKARSTRTAAAGRKQTASTSTTASSAGGSARGRKAAQGAGANTSATTSKTARRVSGISESSESSTSTVVKKGTARAAQDATKETAPAPSTKRTVMGTIRRGMTGTGATKKAAAAKSTKTPASAATGRVLRNRS